MNEAPSTEKYISYKDNVRELGLTLEKAISISQSFSNQNVGPKVYWLSILMIRYINIGVAINRLVPTEGKSPSSSHSWDYGAIATLTRTFIETFHAFYYIGVEDVEEEEWSLRISVFHLHDYSRREEIFKLMGDHSQKDSYQKIKEELLEQISRNTKFIMLHKDVQTKIRKCQIAFLVDKNEIAKKIDPENSLFHFAYKFLSIQTHSLPMSYFRTTREGRGTGVENKIDKEYINMALCWVVNYLKKGNQYMEVISQKLKPPV
ncbi:MAG: hypothetical protein IPP77_11285 [Bacteroidetes bacterium]|nr:hypothetical protein [Bacteroidota bacterium]